MVSGNNSKTKVAAVQATPIFLNRDATVEKACERIVQAGREGARLIVFPETFIPTYPDWVHAVPAGQVQMLSELYAELVANSVSIPDSSTERLCRAAKQAGSYVVMGINERNAEASQASLYNTIIYIDPQGQLLGKHRKLVPTSGERLVWAQGDGSTLNIFETPFARVGGLICWENYMPLARYTMYAQGVQIYAAPTWDSGEPWLSTLRHIAKEGRIFVIGCCIPMRKDDIPDHYEFKQKFYGSVGEWVNVGGSAIVNPNGEFIAGPVREKEEILYAEIDARQMSGPKWLLDVAGHYARPDVFELIVHTEPRQMLSVK
jgi:nitrilase